MLHVDLRKEFWSRGLQMICSVQENRPQLLETAQLPRRGTGTSKASATSTSAPPPSWPTPSTTSRSPASHSADRYGPKKRASLRVISTNPPFAPEVYGAKTGDPGHTAYWRCGSPRRPLGEISEHLADESFCLLSWWIRGKSGSCQDTYPPPCRSE